MKKLLVSLILSLMPISAMAVAPNQFYTLPGNYFFPDKLCIGTTTNCLNGINGVPFTLVPIGFNIASNPFPSSAVAAIPTGIILGHMNVSCISYNPADALASIGPYTPLDSSGLGGATITYGITNATFSRSSPLILGTLVLPTSPQAGPWVTSVNSPIGSPYTILPGDNLTLSVTSVSPAAQVAQGCFAYAGP